MNSDTYNLIEQALQLVDFAELAAQEEHEWNAMMKLGDAKQALNDAMRRTRKFNVDLAAEMFDPRK